VQTADKFLFIRPKSFSFNAQTAQSNFFQSANGESNGIILQEALFEFDSFISILRSMNVDALVFEDTATSEKPDAIFPNNWISMHEDGTVVLYPMQATNRRSERRTDIVDSLKKKFLVNNIIDLSHFENENKFLEGTGSIVFDHKNKIAYGCISPRTDEDLFQLLCERLNYEPILFHATDPDHNAIYHTNVLMSISDSFAVVCLDSIQDSNENLIVQQKLLDSAHSVIDISLEQMNDFAGNMLAVRNRKNEQLIILSETAYKSLTSTQIKMLEENGKLLPIQAKTIESVGGGSVRCMMAEVFLPEL
jgi:hypothetical protein